nr:MAG TPA: hypothetical protein [Siphoviridae sp. ctedi74]
MMSCEHQPLRMDEVKGARTSRTSFRRVSE